MTIVSGCTDDDPYIVDAGSDAIVTSDASVPVDDCIDPATRVPRNLECSGLYENWAEKKVATSAGVREFAPAVALWSDGAEKTRWIQIPAGTKIDNSDPAQWKFPVGTRSWKEFRYKGRRMETRLWVKTAPNWWDKVTYAWQNNETSTRPVTLGETIPLEGGDSYVIPTAQECNQCHEGRGITERLLGFEAPLLGLPGAKGITLATLVQEGLLTHPPAKTTYEVPDDGTGLAKEILPWIHTNCGISCHNENSNTEANHTGLFMRFHPSELEGKPLDQWNIIKNTVGVGSKLSTFPGWTRIMPGSAEQSLLYHLASMRGPVQMPPIGTRIVDPVHTPMFKEWIIRRGALQPKPDGGAPVMPPPDPMMPVPDAGTPMAEPDAAGPVAPPADAAVPDAELDAAVPEVEAAVPPVEVDAYVPPPVEMDAYVPPPPPVEPPPIDVDAAATDGAVIVPTPDPMPPMMTEPVTPPVEMPPAEAVTPV